jgi:DNA-directed RNA polymerase specialized sigma24 family protein
MEATTGTAAGDLSESVASAAAGDEITFAGIVASFDSEMYRVCVAICRDQVVAADVVQAAWSIAWRKLSTVREPGGNP